MYCFNCGAKATGNFCFQCGTRLIYGPTPTSENDKAGASLESRYDEIIKDRHVRDLIKNYASQSPSSPSADDFLKLADLAFVPLSGVSLYGISQIVVPIYQKLGIKTGKTYTYTYPITAPDAIVKVLCSMAKNGYQLQSVEQGNNGLIFVAKLNSDFWTWGGDIIILLEDLQNKTSISIDVKIKGQLYDWGKSKSVIDKISMDMFVIQT